MKTEKQTLGMIGLGRMGGSMALRLLRNGHRCIGYDPSSDNREKLIQEGGEVADSLEELVAKLPGPRAV